MSADVVLEEVPTFTRRYGDHVIQGSNNTIIILGTDRAKAGPAGLGDGNGHIGGPSKGAGSSTVHIIAGRKGKDPDMKDDSSFLYLSKKTKADTNLALTGVAGVSTDDKSSAILKADVIRIVGRKDIKICANDDEKHYMFMNGDKIKIEFNTNATIEIVDKKISIKMGEDTIVMDDKKATITIDKTIITMDGSLVNIDAPKVHLVGGCGKPWDEMFEKMKDYALQHNHMSAVGPTTPVPAGPTASKAADVASKYAAWKAAVAPA